MSETTGVWDRLVRLRAVVAVALAAVVLGGLGGAVVQAATDGADDQGGRFGPGVGGPGQSPGAPGGGFPG